MLGSNNQKKHLEFSTSNLQKINKEKKKAHQRKINPTLAWGFSVDFSEDNEPTDELGDKTGAVEAGAAPTQSEVDDVELLGRRREFTDCVSPWVLPDTGGPSVTSAGEPVFS